MASAPVATTWPEKAMGAFRASPGRSSMLTGLVLILVIAWMRVLVGGHTNPSAARGATAAAVPARTILAEDPAPRRSTESSGLTLQQWARQKSRVAMNRNPFVVPLDFYPSEGSNGSEEVSAGNGYWDLLRKSMSARADQQEQRQILIDNIRIAAESLKLDSTILGSTPGAMVNGQVVHEGSTVAGFRVLKIESNEVIMEREGIRLAVIMN